MQLSLRRAEPRDVEAVLKLTKGTTSGKDDLEMTLKRRFGDHIDIEELIDTSPLSLVGTDADDTTVLGFLALSNGPRSAADEEIPEVYSVDPSATGVLARQDWEKWIRKFYDFKEIQLHNTKFLSYFVADPDHSLAFLDLALTATYTLIPSLRYIAYLLPENTVLFPPLTSTKYQPPAPEEPSTDNGTKKPKKARKLGGRGRKKNAKYFNEVGTKSSNAMFAMHVCLRKDVVPSVKVRKARVEDCDDLVPMFKKQNLLEGKHADFYLAELLESKSERIKTLVAEADGEVVGFMSLNRDVDQELLAETFHVEAFDLLLKLKESDFAHPTLPTTTTTTTDSPTHSHTSLAISDSLPNSSPTLAETSVAPDAPLHPTSRPTSSGTLPRTVTFASTQIMETMDDVNAPLPPQHHEQEEQPKKASPNSFCITMFSMQEEFATQAVEFLRAAFPLFPDRDYCVVTVPTGVGEMPLLRGFVACKEKAGRTASHCLYVANRFGISDPPPTIRLSLPEDLPLVDNLVTGMDIELEIMSMYRAAISKDPPSPYIPYIAEHNSQLVALILLEKCSDEMARNITEQFSVEEYASLRSARIGGGWPVLLRGCVVNPLFECQGRWILEEVMRIAATTCLLYPHDDRARRDAGTGKIVWREFVPVKRRRRIQFPNNLRDGLTLPPPLEWNLSMITTSLLYEPKIVVNTRIVVVGGSDTGVSFLEKLAYSSHLHFSNLTLIADQGLPSVRDDADGPGMFATRRCFTGLELKQIGLETYAQIIRSSTVEFDRILKRVRLNNGSYVAYVPSFLPLPIPTHPKNTHQKHNTTKNKTPASKLKLEKDVRKAVDAVVRDEYEKSVVCVYGRDVQAFATVQMLLSQGLPPQQIIHVIPPLTTPSSCFDDVKVDDIINRTTTELGITTYRDSKLVDWEEMQGALTAITIKNKQTRQTTRLWNVTLFLYADTKSVAPDTFASINDSSLVFDGKLVVDKHYRTQDPFIYAAGTITKYSSKYQTRWSHEVYDSREVGAKLADLLLPLFDPVAMPVEMVDSDELLRFEQAKKVEAVLPGNLHYFHFDKPRLPSQTLEWRQRQEGYGRDLISTPPPEDPNSYFRIHIAPDGRIHSLTYLGTRRIPADNYTCLYMMHEKYLNRFVGRFDEGIVGDFVKFLNEPWALPLYHDRFADFTRALRQQMLTSPDEESQEIVETLLEHVKDKAPIPEDEQKDLYKAFDVAPSRRKWDKQVFDFLMGCDLYESFP
ncbi:hypothetical protein HDV00_000949 [Rhizophlyctis rosea]|nr:hypothetical protein HDV00_000949 [Rhizophlyctis rosea]